MGSVLPPYCSISVSNGSLRGDHRLIQQIEEDLDFVRRVVLERFSQQLRDQNSEIRILWETTHNNCSCSIFERGGTVSRVVVFNPQDLKRVLIEQWCYLALKGENDLKEELAGVMAAVALGSQPESFSTHINRSIQHAFSLMMASGEEHLQRKIWEVWVQAMHQLDSIDTKLAFASRTVCLGERDPMVQECLLFAWSHVGFRVQFQSTVPITPAA